LYDTALLDLDGVVYRGVDAVPHAVSSLMAAAKAGMRLAYVTNNASRTPEAVAEHLRELGLPVEAEDVVTAAQAVARLIAEQVPAGARVLVIGGDGMRQALLGHGLTIVSSADDDPAAVVQGYRPDTSWQDLAEAAYAVERGVPWFAANTDRTMPTARGIAPGNGALVGAVAAATGTWPTVAGKPEPALHRETMLRTEARRPLVVGDRLDTDIEGAFNGEVDSLLVLTGVTDGAQLLAAPPQHRPTYLDADLRGLLTGQPEVVEEGDGFRCGGWTARAGSERLELAGDGEALDGLRALCAAAWTAAGDGTCELDGGKALARLGL
jgi:HAD superfamily hydrolase (TIGR01450 family)